MDQALSVAGDLQSLTSALDNPGVDFTAMLQRLHADLRQAIPSYVGLSMSVGIATGRAFTLTACTNEVSDSAVASSVHVPLGQPETPNATVTLYAIDAGAFTHLAADLAWILSIDLRQLHLDEHVGGPPPHSALDEVRHLNRAIGVLIDAGFVPHAARRELRLRAAKAGHTLAQEAVAVLRQVESTG